MRGANKTVVACCLLAVLAGALPARAQAPPLEYQVKASYLYNFMQFVAWPEEAFRNQRTFNLCVVGAERFGTALRALMGERAEEREIRVQPLERAAQARALNCHLLFIAAGHGTDPVGVERGMLTVGETAGFLERGGIINLVEVGGRVRFEISQRAAERAGLVVSSRLLSLALRQL